MYRYRCLQPLVRLTGVKLLIKALMYFNAGCHRRDDGSGVCQHSGGLWMGYRGMQSFISSFCQHSLMCHTPNSSTHRVPTHPPSSHVGGNKRVPCHWAPCGYPAILLWYTRCQCHHSHPQSPARGQARPLGNAPAVWLHLVCARNH